uniref:ribonuclease H n=1 Tax=Leptobrachium leishanense TaxID=445787 RepID=A0A8C5ML73_9ANUR
MDPADLTQHLANFVSRQDEQDHRMDQFAIALQTILTRTAHLEPAGVAPPLDIPVSPVVQTSQVHMTAPMRFDGTPSECRGFLVHVDIHFKLNPQMFFSDIAKVGFIINHLSGRALTWATPLWEAEKPIIGDYKEFIAELQRTFNPTRKATVAGKSLFRIRQGNRTVSDYAIEFKTLISDVNWTNETLVLAFMEGLSESLMHELAPRKLPEVLCELIVYCIDLDNQIRDRRTPREKPKRPLPRLAPVFQAPPRELSPPSEPMQLGRTRLTEEERTRRFREGLCLYCGLGGHVRFQCPTRPKMHDKPEKLPHLRQLRRQALGVTCMSPVKDTKLMLPVSLAWETKTTHTTAFLDSGAAGNFIDVNYTSSISLPLVVRETPLAVEAIDGRPLSCPRITHDTVTVVLTTGLLHKEEIIFQVIHSPSNPVVLGFPWLVEHNPVIDWAKGEILSWSPACFGTCLIPIQHVGALNTPTAPPLSTEVPDQYADLRAVFDKREAEKLPPHRPYDCAIDIHPGTMPPRGKVYPLSIKENQIMEEYIKENLERGFIRRSSSPAGAGFFFVSKKEGDLRPCIDYRGLNKITIKNVYPIPLISELFDRLRGSAVYTKLDLRGAYNLIRIKEGHEWRTAFNTRSGHYEYLVMPFGLCVRILEVEPRMRRGGRRGQICTRLKTEEGSRRSEVKAGGKNRGREKAEVGNGKVNQIGILG